MTRKTHLPSIAAGIALAVLPFTAACGDDEVEAGTPGLPSVTNSSAPVNPPITPPSTPATPPAATVGEPGAEGGLSQEALEGRIGQTVTVTGEVATMVGPNAFTLGGDEIGENPVLVVSANAPQVREGDPVRVSGQVIRFSVPGVQEDLDIDLVDNEFEDFDGDPAIRASTVEPTAATDVGDGGQGGAAQESLEGRIGQSVTLRGEVAELLGPNAFTVGGDEVGENPILVVSAMKSSVQAGDTVRIQGKVIRFSVPGVEEDFDLDLIDDEFEDFDGDPAISATLVTP